MKVASRVALGVACVLGASTIARGVAAYESHQFMGDDVRASVDEAGMARLEHAIAYAVTGGALKGFDVNGVEPDAVIDPAAPVTVDGDLLGDARVERKGERQLHVTIDPATHPPKRGTYVVRLKYAVDLVRSKELTRDGSMWRLAWTSPVAPEGFDGARLVLDLPAAPTEPRALADDGTTGTPPTDANDDRLTMNDGRVVALRRLRDRDELDMTRPHVARGESPSWGARVDPRAFPRVTAPDLRVAPIAATPPPPPEESWRAWGIALLVGFAFALLASTKSGAWRLACDDAGVTPRPLLARWSNGARAALAGASFALGIGCEASERPTVGAAAIVLAMVALVERAPKERRLPRGPGQWLALKADEAFARQSRASRGGALDGSTLGGVTVAVLGALGSIALGLALRPVDPEWVWLAPLDAMILLPLFATGTRRQLPPDRSRDSAGTLAALHRALRRDEALRVAPWARVPLGAGDADELRLLVVPRAPMPGVVGIEVGVAWTVTPTGYAPEPEILVRVREDSAAAARMTALVPKRRPVPGRKLGEKVIRVAPTTASRAAALALVKRLVSELRDRRKTTVGAAAWKGAERRLPANERAKGEALAA